MKKLISIIIIAVMLLSALIPMSLCVSAAEKDVAAEVRVTVSDASGALVLAYKSVEVTDTDGDSKLTISDALYCAHEKYYENGAKAGYMATATEYGLSLVKLWGDASGIFGYYVNNASALSLSDGIKDGDYICAYVYTDTQTWSDSYSYFDKPVSEVDRGKTLELRLTAVTFDVSFNLVPKAVEGAVITIDGKDTAIKTNAEGVAVIPVEDDGEHIISARHDTMTLVPPVCILNEAKAGDTSPVAKPAPAPSENTVAALATEADEDDGKDEKAKDDEEDGGCSGTLIASGIAVLAVSGTSALIFVKRRRSEDEE